MAGKVRPVSVNMSVKASAGKGVADYDWRVAYMDEGPDIRRSVEKLFSEKAESRRSQLIRIAAVISVPIIALVILSAFSMTDVVGKSWHSAEATSAIDEFFRVDDLVTSLQVERGTSAAFLSSGGSNVAARERLGRIRQDSDIHVERLSYISVEVNGTKINDVTEYSSFMANLRQGVNDMTLTFEESTRMYTKLNDAFLDLAITNVVLPEDKDLWRLFVAVSSLLRASDAIGIHRALGATFFIVCGYSTGVGDWFLRLDGQVEADLQLAFLNHPESGYRYRRDFLTSTLHRAISDQTRKMTSSDYVIECRDLPNAVRYDNSLAWFSDQTSHLSIVKAIRTDLIQNIRDRLEAIQKAAKSRVLTFCVIPVLVLLVILALSAWHLRHSYKASTLLVDNLTCQAADRVSREKKRCQALLRHGLPHPIQQLLKQGQHVTPERFDRVTVCCSRLLGMGTLADDSAPKHMVEVSNSIFRLLMLRRTEIGFVYRNFEISLGLLSLCRRQVTNYMRTIQVTKYTTCAAYKKK